MKNTISFFLAVIFLISLFYTGFAYSMQQEEFSLSAFARTYGKSLGDLAYNSLFDFNRNNSIDNDDLEVIVSNTPLKSLTAVLSETKKRSSKKKKTSGKSEGDSSDEDVNHLDIDKDGDVDAQDVNLMNNLLSITWMMNSFIHFSVRDMFLTVKSPEFALTLPSFYANIGYTPVASNNFDFISLTLEMSEQFENQYQSKKKASKLKTDSNDLIQAANTSSNLLLLNMQVLEDVIKLGNLGPVVQTPPEPLDVIFQIPDKMGGGDVQTIKNQTTDKQQLMSDNQQKERRMKHLSTNTPILVDQNSRNNHYDKSAEKEALDLDILKQ